MVKKLIIKHKERYTTTYNLIGNLKTQLNLHTNFIFQITNYNSLGFKIGAFEFEFPKTLQTETVLQKSVLL